MVSKLSREGSYRKGLEVFEALPAVGLVRSQPAEVMLRCHLCPCASSYVMFISGSQSLSAPDCQRSRLLPN